jgi:hypothetical protein
MNNDFIRTTVNRRIGNVLYTSTTITTAVPLQLQQQNQTNSENDDHLLQHIIQSTNNIRRYIENYQRQHNFQNYNQYYDPSYHNQEQDNYPNYNQTQDNYPNYNQYYSTYQTRRENYENYNQETYNQETYNQETYNQYYDQETQEQDIQDQDTQDRSYQELERTYINQQEYEDYITQSSDQDEQGYSNLFSYTLDPTSDRELIVSLFRPILNNFVSGFDNDFEDVKVTLSEDEFNRFKNVIVTEDNLEEYCNKDCNICLESYALDEVMVIIKCNHIFHKECIHMWLCNQNVKCPVCRTDNR